MKAPQYIPSPYPAPPEHLSERSCNLWREIGPRHIDTAERRVLFEQALRALDRATEAHQLIQAEGLISKTASTGASHIHPAAKIEIENRRQFAQIWTQLRLDQVRDALGRIVR